MSSCNYTLAVNSSAIRPIVSNKFGHFNASLSPSVKTNVKTLPQIPKLREVGQVIKEASIKILDVVADFTFEFVDQKWLPSQSNFAPVEEIDEAIPVFATKGCIPDDFPEGIYIRNGCNSYFGALQSAKSVFGKSSGIWVEGEGMLHSVNFNKGSINGEWNILYYNKYVESNSFKLEKERKKPAYLPAAEGDSLAVLAAGLFNVLRFGDANKAFSNTNVIEHSGKFYSLDEAHVPQEFDIQTLKTLGDWDMVMNDWNRPFTSHPKKDLKSGELIICGVQPVKPYLMIGVISDDGKKLVHKADLKLDRSIICHETGITERYNIILDFPLIVDIGRLLKGGPLIKHEKEKRARIGVMLRYGDADSTRWFDVKSANVFHIVNCFEEGDEVAVIACKSRGSIIPGPDFGADKLEWFSKAFNKPINGLLENEEDTLEGSLFTRPYEWRMNMKTGEVKEKYLTGFDFSMDFPFVNENVVGRKNKYGYTQVVDSMASSVAGHFRKKYRNSEIAFGIYSTVTNSGFEPTNSMGKYGGLAKLYFEEKEHTQTLGEETTRVEYHKFPEDTFGTGTVFVPKPGGVEEDDGWIISFVHNESTNISQAYIIDAKKFTSEPIAVIGIPVRVPYGFHGGFFATNS